MTGGAGFIGSHLVESLLANDHDVTIYDDLSSGYAENLAQGARFVEGDVADIDALRPAVADAEVVFHLGAHRAVLRSVERPLETDRANVRGTLAVLQSAREAGARRVVYASSSSIYGGALLIPTPETAPALPRSPYAVSKLAGEHYSRVFTELYGLETVSLRFFNVFGPRQRPDAAYAAVIPLFIESIRDGRQPEVHGDGQQSRDFTYISDVVDAVMAAAQAPSLACSGRAFNIAGGDSFSLLDILAMLEEFIGRTCPPRFVDGRPGDVRHTKADISAAARHLGYRPRVSFEEGLRETARALGLPVLPPTPRVLAAVSIPDHRTSASKVPQ